MSQKYFHLQQKMYSSQKGEEKVWLNNVKATKVASGHTKQRKKEKKGVAISSKKSVKYQKDMLNYPPKEKRHADAEGHKKFDFRAEWMRPLFLSDWMHVLRYVY